MTLAMPARARPASHESIPLTGELFEVTLAGDSPDGRWIYIQPSHRNIRRMPAQGGRLEQVTHFPEAGLFLEEPTISPDGRYLYYCRGNGGSSLWLLKLEPSESADTRKTL